jgi:hypothetical protein
MTKTDLYGSCMAPEILRFAHADPRAAARAAAQTKSDFRHNFSKKLSPGPKINLERRVSRFSTICAKNYVLELKIDKVTVILRLNSPFWRFSPVQLYLGT